MLNLLVSAVLLAALFGIAKYIGSGMEDVIAYKKEKLN